MLYFIIILSFLFGLNVYGSDKGIRSKVQSLADSSQIFMEKRYYKKSLDYAERAFKEIRRSNFEKDTLYANIIVLLAKNYSYNKKFDLSYKYFKQYTEITSSIYGDTSIEYVRSLINYSIINRELNNFDTVKYLLKKSINILTEHLPEEKETLAICLGRMGNMYQEDFQFDNARPYLLRSLELFNELYPDGHTYTALQLMSLGYNYHQRYDLVRAEKFKSKAVEMFEQIDAAEDERYANALLNLAYVYIDQGRLELAKETMERSVKMYKNLGNSHSHRAAFAVMSLGLIHYHLKEYDTSKNLYMKALSTFQKDFDYEHHNMTRLYDNLGELFEQMGDLDSAIYYYKKSAELSRRIYDNGGNLLPITYLNLVDIYFKKGQIEKVEEYTKLADLHFREILPDNHLYILYVKYAYAQMHLLNERIDSVRSYYSSAFKILKNYFKTNSINLSENEHYQFLTTIKSHFDSFNTMAIKYHDKNPSLINDMLANQLFYKGVLLSSQKKISNSLYESNDTTAQQLYNNWLNNKDLYAKLYRQYSINDSEEHQHQLDSLSEVINNYEKELSSKSAQLNFEDIYSELKVEQLKDKLAENQAIVSIFRCQSDQNSLDSICYAAVILTKDNSDSPYIVLIKNGYDLENIYIKMHYNALKYQQPDDFSYVAFWKPIQDKLNELEVDHIYLSSEGIYHKINIGALFNPKTQRYAEDDITINYIINPKDILKKSSSVNNQYAVLFGNPDFYSDKINALSLEQTKDDQIIAVSDQTKRGISDYLEKYSINPLPGTKNEIKQIAQILDTNDIACHIFSEEEANEENLKSIKKPRILHIATHAIFLRNYSGNEIKDIRETMMESMLLLTNSGSSFDNIKEYLTKEDGIFTAYEAQGLQLDGTELVVLSACETGLGKIMNGEGVFGLQRAFSIAGARSIIMSLWKVDDTATQLFMIDFYKNWLSGKTKHEAMLSARESIRNIPEYSHPYYWAGFILIGL